MRYSIKHTLAVCAFWLSFFAARWVDCSAATPAEGQINDAEFVIEKQRRNKLSEEKKLFFKAPLPQALIRNLPWQPLQPPSEQTLDWFNRAPSELAPPHRLPPKAKPAPGGGSLALGLNTQPSLHLLLRCPDFPLGMGRGSVQAAWVPPTAERNVASGCFSLESRQRKARWLLGRKCAYVCDRHGYAEAPAMPTRTLHRFLVRLGVERADDQMLQRGSLASTSLGCFDRSLFEQLVQLHHKLLKPCNGVAFWATTHADFAHYCNAQTTQNRLLLSLKPGVCIDFLGNGQLKASLKVACHNDPMPNGVSNFQCHPSVRASYGVTDWLQPYLCMAGMNLGGNVRPLHLSTLTVKNPFLAKNVALLHKHEYLRIQGGNKGTVGALSHHVNVAYRQCKNATRKVFAADRTTYRLLYRTHPPSSAKVAVALHGTLPGVRIGTTTKVTYCRTFEKEVPPLGWYAKPTLKIKPMLRYAWQKKLFLTGGLLFQNAVALQDAAGVVDRLRPVVDTHLGATYFLTSRWALFLRGDNLLNRKNRLHTGTPGVSRTFLGGVQYRILQLD